MDFFGTSWETLTAADVESFLADAGDEGLLWEAKGNSQPHREGVRKAVCGFANAEGGFLIVGAERDDDGSWRLPGVAFNVQEPGTWLSSVISDGLRPAPWFDVKTFDRDDEHVAAVVAVKPIVVPPCMTASGVAYQRVTGQTVPVADQRVLADLLARGREARAQAEALAMRAADRALVEPAAQPPNQAMFSAALCPLQPTDRLTSVLYTESFARIASDIIGRRLQVNPGIRYPVRIEPRQDCAFGYPASRETNSSWTAAVYADGSASAVFTSPITELYPGDLIAFVLQAWSALVELLLASGSAGQAFLVVRVRGQHAAVASFPRGHPGQPIRRWTSLADPTEDECASLTRELQRGFGQVVWDPEPTR